MPVADQVAPRRPKLAAQLAWLACGLALALLVAGLILLLSSPDGPLPKGYLTRRQQTLSLVSLLGPPLLGGLIAARRPSNPYGWLWSAYALGWALASFNEAYVTYVSASGAERQAKRRISTRWLLIQTLERPGGSHLTVSLPLRTSPRLGRPGRGGPKRRRRLRPDAHIVPWTPGFRREQRQAARQAATGTIMSLSLSKPVSR